MKTERSTKERLPGSKSGALVVCERTGSWAGWLRAEISRAAALHDAWPLVEVRSPAECLEQIASAPGSFVVIELSAASCDAALELLVEIDARYPQVRAAVAAERAMRDYQWLARELGAVEFVCSPRRAGSVLVAARAHLRDRPRPNPSVTERIWAELPWSA